MAMNSLFAPAEALMNALRYPKKFILISLIFSLPIGFLSFLYLHSLTTEIAFLEKEQIGGDYIEHLRPLLEHIPKHRGMTNGYLNGNLDFKEKILAERKAVDFAFQELIKAEEEHGADLGTEKYPDHKPDHFIQMWEGIKSRSFSGEPPAIFEEHTLLIKHLIQHIKHIADLSNLTLDPKLDSYYSIQLLTQSIPELTEIMGRGRGFGSGLTAKGEITPREWAKLALLQGQILSYKNSVSDALDAMFDYNTDLKQELESYGSAATNEVSGFTALLKEKILDAETITISSGEVFSAGTKAIAASFALFDKTLPALHNMLQKRIDYDNNLLLLSVITLAGVLMIVAYIFIGFYYSTLNTIHALDKEMTRIAEGDLNAQVKLKTRDEMSIIGDRFNLMAQNFRELVGQVKNATDQVAESASQMSVVTLQTSEGVSQQQNETEQVATAINEMNATVHEVASNAASAAEAASNANQEAISGQHIVDQAIKSINQLAGEIESVAGVIHGLENDSENIGTVLDVIKNIAEQTNLLALNAAIEAARAGEQGRGFAVVADEVRTLASRTQQSTTEIEDMIDKLQDAAKNAVNKMEQGQTRTKETVEQATNAGQSLAAITQAVSVINDMNTQIASASEEQSSVAEEINQNIIRISKISEDAAEGTQKTQSHSEELSRLSGSLQTLLMKFKV